jgi:hypothetical protein
VKRKHVTLLIVWDEYIAGNPRGYSYSRFCELYRAFESRHFYEEESLSFFYAKHVPFVEGTGRILIGAGRIKQIGKLTDDERANRR